MTSPIARSHPEPQLVPKTLRHLAIIMDGNGRWAQRRGEPRSRGHRCGVERTKDIVDYVASLSIPYLTLYAFSAENWRRPQSEVNFLMRLLEQFIDEHLARLKANNVRVRILGERTGLTPKIRTQIRDTQASTKHNDGLNLQIAFNYGGQQEIVAAARKLATAVHKGEQDPAAITERHFAQALYAGDVPPCDLLVRTGGEYRLSNFLLWQSAYAELYFEQRLWPDFDRAALDYALKDYARRVRRFGGTAHHAEMYSDGEPPE